MTEKLMTPAEAAELLNIGYHRMLEMVNTGEIESIPVGKRRRITETAIERWQRRALSTPPIRQQPKKKKKPPTMRELMEREAARTGPIPRRRYGDVAKA